MSPLMEGVVAVYLLVFIDQQSLQPSLRPHTLYLAQRNYYFTRILLSKAFYLILRKTYQHFSAIANIKVTRFLNIAKDFMRNTFLI